MKTIKNSKLTKAILVTAVLFLSAPSVFAYPPDNAAVLYCKASMLYQVDDEMDDMLHDLWKGRIELNEKIKEFVKKNQNIISIVLDASEATHCDWGIDYSKGFEIMMPPLHKFKQFSKLITADATILAQQGDYETALCRCISLYKMAQHVNERTAISYMIGVVVNAVTNDCIIEILSGMPQDVETLNWLKSQLFEIDSLGFSIKPALAGEREVGIISFVPEKISNVVHSYVDDEAVKKEILAAIAADEEFLTRNRDYWSNHMADVTAAFDLPYPQAYTKLEQLSEKPCKEYNEDKNPDATLTAVFAPALSKVCSLSIRSGSHYNAVKTGLEIYIIKAKTGKLPDTLPAGLPGDLFSGKPFQYEKTADGFILRCQGRDLVKDEIHEYEFKVKK